MRLAKRPRRARRARLIAVKHKEIDAGEHMRLVHSIVNKRLKRMGLPAKHPLGEDLRGEGMIALVRAAKNYKPRRGTRFSTFATRYIEGAVGRAVKQQGLIRVSEREVRRQFKAAKKARIPHGGFMKPQPLTALEAAGDRDRSGGIEASEWKLRFHSLTKGLPKQELRILRESAIYSTGEISKRLKLPKTTVHRILTRVKAKIRQKEAA